MVSRCRAISARSSAAALVLMSWGSVMVIKRNLLGLVTKPIST
jgi:hypothetical protein